MSAMREELHQLVDQLPEDEVQPALELIRDRVAKHGQGRDLPFFASFEAEPELTERAGRDVDEPGAFGVTYSPFGGGGCGQRG